MDEVSIYQCICLPLDGFFSVHFSSMFRRYFFFMSSSWWPRLPFHSPKSGQFQKTKLVNDHFMRYTVIVILLYFIFFTIGDLHNPMIWECPLTNLFYVQLCPGLDYILPWETMSNHVKQFKFIYVHLKKAHKKYKNHSTPSNFCGLLQQAVDTAQATVVQISQPWVQA